MRDRSSETPFPVVTVMPVINFTDTTREQAALNGDARFLSRDKTDGSRASGSNLRRHRRIDCRCLPSQWTDARYRQTRIFTRALCTQNTPRYTRDAYHRRSRLSLLLRAINSSFSFFLYKSMAFTHRPS